MSYSFTVTADTKDEAGVKIEAELAKIVGYCPEHEFDRQAAQNAAETFIDVLADPAEGQHIVVSMSGSLSWRDTNVFTGASVIVGACVKAKE